MATQKIKARVACLCMECAGQLSARSDASFKRKEETGYGMRGAVSMRLDEFLSTGKEVCHLFDAVSRSREP
eukprot:1614748-Pyramimonas_sp.AAC.1